MLLRDRADSVVYPCIPYAGQDEVNKAPRWYEVACVLCRGPDHLVPHHDGFICVWCKSGEPKPIWAKVWQRMPEVP